MIRYTIIITTIEFGASDLENNTLTMDEMKDKWKGFMNKVNNQISSSSSGKFKGQGRVLGSSSSGSVNPAVLTRPAQNQTPIKKPIPSSSSSSSSSKPVLPSKPSNSDQNKPSSTDYPQRIRGTENGFDPYGSLITSSKVSKNGFTLNVFECPICGASYKSEEEVSEHVETCVNANSSDREGGAGDAGSNKDELEESRSELDVCVGSFLSGNPPDGSVEVIIRLLRNIVKEPGNDKFRKIRMSNPKIREAVGEVAGGVELLEFVGFELKEERGEVWAVMESPKEERIGLINKTIMLLEPGKIEQLKKSENVPSVVPTEKEESIKPKKIDRQVNQLFCQVPLFFSLCIDYHVIL